MRFLNVGVSLRGAAMLPVSVHGAAAGVQQSSSGKSVGMCRHLCLWPLVALASQRTSCSGRTCQMLVSPISLGPT